MSCSRFGQLVYLEVKTPDLRMLFCHMYKVQWAVYNEILTQMPTSQTGPLSYRAVEDYSKCNRNEQSAHT